MAPRVELDIYGRTNDNDELGFPPEVEDDEAGELLARSTLARSSCSVSRSTTPATSTAGSAASPYSIAPKPPPSPNSCGAHATAQQALILLDLGELTAADAIEHLTDALPRLPASFVRAAPACCRRRPRPRHSRRPRRRSAGRCHRAANHLPRRMPRCSSSTPDPSTTSRRSGASPPRLTHGSRPAPWPRDGK